MQIHELTQPKKSKLDEIEMFGPGGLASEIGSVIRNPRTLLPGAKSQAAADQKELNRRAAKAIAQGKDMRLDRKPTLASGMDRLRANPVAKEWIAGIVANWPQEAKNLGLPGSTVKEAPEYTTPGGIIVPANSKTAPSPATPATPATPTTPSAPPPSSGDIYKKAVKDWIDTQLKTIKLDTIMLAKDKYPQLKGIERRLTLLLDTMSTQAGNVPAQQETLKQILALVTAANHVIEWERRVGRGPTLADPGAGNRAAQPVNTGLTLDQLKNLGAMAARSGEPAPKSTDNDWWDSFIQQAIAAAKQ